MRVGTVPQSSLNIMGAVIPPTLAFFSSADFLVCFPAAASSFAIPNRFLSFFFS